MGGSPSWRARPGACTPSTCSRGATGTASRRCSTCTAGRSTSRSAGETGRSGEGGVRASSRLTHVDDLNKVCRRRPVRGDPVWRRVGLVANEEVGVVDCSNGRVLTGRGWCVCRRRPPTNCREAAATHKNNTERCRGADRDGHNVVLERVEEAAVGRARDRVRVRRRVVRQRNGRRGRHSHGGLLHRGGLLCREGVDSRRALRAESCSSCCSSRGQGYGRESAHFTGAATERIHCVTIKLGSAPTQSGRAGGSCLGKVVNSCRSFGAVRSWVVDVFSRSQKTLCARTCTITNPASSFAPHSLCPL